MKTTDDPTLIHTQVGLEAGQEGFFVPPTTHLVATIEDLMDMLDYASEEAEDMEEEDRAPTPVNTGRWTATSTYDVYMVDTTADNSERTPANNGDESGEARSRRRKPHK